MVGAVLWTVLATFTVLTFGLGAPVMALLGAVPFLYTWLSVAGGLSATPGQAMMGLRVRQNADLGPPGAGAALIWTVGYMVTVALGAIWLAVALITGRNRTGHDLVAGLVVVRVDGLRRPLTTAAPPWTMRAGGEPPTYV